uniref:DUF547 domain-containing protein n=1 Tax=Eiseniibacteriota bacterium TaxID=2212470 RepID=A0A832I5V9_UNCEI
MPTSPTPTVVHRARAPRIAPFALLALLAPAAVAAQGAGAAPAARAAPAAAAAPDLSGYQRLLDDYLVVVSAPGRPLDTRFDYERLYDARDRDARLDAVRAQMFAVPPSAMAPRARLAWALNAYNFLVLEQATRNLLIPGKGRTRHTDPRMIRVKGWEFFKAPVVTIEGVEYSLDAFERTFVRLGWKAGAEPMPEGFDPRVHFALVCGARGCPPLMPRVYRADSLDRQLDAATRNALAMPRHLRYDGARLEVSEMFRWYMAEFGGRSGALDFIRRHAPPKLRARLEADRVSALHGFIPWDWTLNQFPRNQVQ